MLISAPGASDRGCSVLLGNLGQSLLVELRGPQALLPSVCWTPGNLQTTTKVGAAVMPNRWMLACPRPYGPGALGVWTPLCGPPFQCTGPGPD